MRRRRKKILILVILIVAALLAAASYFLLSFYVPDEQAEVQGNIRYTDAEIRRMAMPGFKEHNSLFLRFFRSEIPLPDVPFIDSIEVEYLARDRVRLHANEEYPVGYILEGGYRYYFNSSGIVTENLEDEVQKKEEQKQQKAAEAAGTEETGSAKEKGSDTAFRPALTGVSQVTGLTDTVPAVGEQIQTADSRIFQTLQTLGKLANKLNIHPDEILIDDDQTMTLRYDEVLVDLGTERLLDEKMSRAAAILPQLEGLKGTLHLESFSPSTINIVFSAWREGEPEPGEAAPEEAAAEETLPEEALPEEALPEEALPQEALPEEALPQEALSQEVLPEQAAAEEWVPEETYYEEQVYYADEAGNLYEAPYESGY